MRAHDAALAALEAQVRVPDRHFDGDVAFFEARRARRKRAVHRHVADGNGVAAPSHDLAGDLAHEQRRVGRHDGRDGVARAHAIGHTHLAQAGQCGIDRREVELHQVAALGAIGLLDGVLDLRNGLVGRQHLRQMEEAGLQDGVGAHAQAGAHGDVGGVDHPELELAIDQRLLHFARQMVPDLVGAIGAVEQKGAAGPGLAQHVDAAQEVELVAGDEMRLADQVGRGDRLVAEAQVRGGFGAGLVRVVVEVGLRIAPGNATQDLHAVLVGAHRAVGAQAVEQAAHGARGLDVQLGVIRQAGVAHVVVDAHGETVARLLARGLVEHRLGHAGVEVLGRQPVAPADHARHAGAPAGGHGLRQHANDVGVQRLHRRAGLLGAVQHGDAAHAGRQRGQKGIDREGAIQQDLHGADLLLGVLRVQPGGRLAHHLGARAHADHHALGVGWPVVAHQRIAAPGQLGKAVHGLLHHAGHARVERVAGLARLEVGVGVLPGAADDRVFGAERTQPVLAHQTFVDHRADLFVRNQRHAVVLVRGAKAVGVVDDGHAPGQRGGLCDQRQVVALLHRRRAQDGKAGAARGHDVLVVAEDRRGRRGQRARRDVEHGGCEFARDLVHVGQHQHQPLRCGERRGQRAGLQRAVHAAGGAALGLHLLHHRDLAPEVALPGGRPGVGQLGHHRGWRDRIDRADFVDAVGDPGDGGVAVHGFKRDGGRHGVLHSLGRAHGRTLKRAGATGSPRLPMGSVAAAGSGTISMAWQGHCSKQIAQPVHSSVSTA